jgi:hypothetical protein
MIPMGISTDRASDPRPTLGKENVTSSFRKTRGMMIVLGSFFIAFVLLVAYITTPSTSSTRLNEMSNSRPLNILNLLEQSYTNAEDSGALCHLNISDSEIYSDDGIQVSDGKIWKFF